jgi:hypothetical protein
MNYCHHRPKSILFVLPPFAIHHDQHFRLHECWLAFSLRIIDYGTFVYMSYIYKSHRISLQLLPFSFPSLSLLRVSFLSSPWRLTPDEYKQLLYLLLVQFDNFFVSFASYFRHFPFLFTTCLATPWTIAFPVTHLVATRLILK